MRAVASTRRDPEAGAGTLEDVELPIPPVGPHDVLVRVRAVSVNRLDVRLAGRQKASPASPRVLGWDASGTIEALGDAVKGFAVGDAVFYVGDIRRPGSNAQFQAVDSRLIARMPAGLGFVEAAALPLAAITAWNMLFDHFGLDRQARGRLLVLGGGSGVATLAILLARARTQTAVIGSASRPESSAWLYRIGAHHVLSHAEPLAPQIQEMGWPGVDYAFSMHTGPSQLAELLAVARLRGKIGFVDAASSVDLALLRDKSLTLHAESMWATLVHGSPEKAGHAAILDEIAALCMAEAIPPIVTRHLSGLSAKTVQEAHGIVAAGHTLGKLVISFD